MLSHVAIQSRLLLVEEPTALNGAEIVAVLGVFDVPVFVNKSPLADLALNGHKMHPIHMAVQEPGILESSSITVLTRV